MGSAINPENMGITSSNTHTIQANKQPKQSKWRPSRTPPTTSPSPSRAEVPKLRRRPTSKLLRTVMPASEPVPLLPRMPSQTRLINPPTRARLISTRRLPPGFRLATYKSFVLHAPNYLQHLASLLRSRGVELQRKKLSSVQEAYNSQEFGSVSLVVNCTGLGAKSLLGYPREDVKDIYPIRGQTVLIKAPKDYKMKCFMLTEDHPNENTTKDSELSEPTYIIPRPGPEKHVILGGAFQINNWESEPDYALSKRILQKNFKLYPGLAPPGAKSWEDIEIVSHNVGFRPARQNGCRLDLEELTLDASSTSALPNAALIPKESLKRSTGAAAATSGQKVALVQAYGAGPAGYKASIGYALETADICDGWWAQHGGRKGSKAKL